jgi:hypothetical protein
MGQSSMQAIRDVDNALPGSCKRLKKQMNYPGIPPYQGIRNKINKQECPDDKKQNLG